MPLLRAPVLNRGSLARHLSIKIFRSDQKQPQHLDYPASFLPHPESITTHSVRVVAELCWRTAVGVLVLTLLVAGLPPAVQGQIRAGPITDAMVPDTITIAGTNNVSWGSLNKTGSSLADLATRVVSNLQASTSAELFDVLSNETGSGTGARAVFNQAPIFTGPSPSTSTTFVATFEDFDNDDLLRVRSDGNVLVGKSFALTSAASWFSIQSGADGGGAVILTNSTGGLVANAVGFLNYEIRVAGSNQFENVSGIGGILGSSNTSAGNVLTGMKSDVRLTAAGGRAATMIGGSFSARSNDATAGTITTLTGSQSIALVDEAGVTATNVYGHRVQDIANVGTMTNTYGLHVGDITSGTQTNLPYNIYLSDTTARNYLGGATIVSGTVRANGGYLSADGTAGSTVTTCTGFKDGLCISGS